MYKLENNIRVGETIENEGWELKQGKSNKTKLLLINMVWKWENRVNVNYIFQINPQGLQIKRIFWKTCVIMFINTFVSTIVSRIRKSELSSVEIEPPITLYNTRRGILLSLSLPLSLSLSLSPVIYYILFSSYRRHTHTYYILVLYVFVHLSSPASVSS